MKNFKQIIKNILLYSSSVFALAFLWKLLITNDAHFAAEESFEIFLFAFLGTSVGEAAYRYQMKKSD